MKLLKHKNAVILFMSSKAIYVYKDKYEELLAKEQAKQFFLFTLLLGGISMFVSDEGD